VRHPEQNSLALGLFYVGVCGGVWLMGYTMRVRRRYVLGLEERAATLERERDHLARIAVADERAAIARELHDVVAHSLAVMIVQADGGRYALEADPAQARTALETVAATGREALEDMRRLVGVLRGSQPDDHDPLDRAVAVDRRREGLGQLHQLVDRATSAGLDVDVEVDGPVADLPPAVELAVFRLAQEALTNVIRHAGARARVDLRVLVTAGDVTLSVVDDGGGAAAPSPDGGAGHGLIGMRERIGMVGGTLDAGPRPGGGFRISALLPLKK